MRHIETVSQFIEWASQFNDGHYLFRGVSKSSYKIEASAYRRLITNKTAARLLEVNQELINDARGRGHDQKNGQQLSDLELLAELQHFGAATCLIDFTRSALVALWFACQQSSAKDETNGKVFAVYSDIIACFKTITPGLIKKDIDHFFKPANDGIYPLYQWEPKLQNNRIIAQHSVFVFGGAQIEAEEECIIAQSSKREILKSLSELSDITEATMYPDFDGFARLHAHNQPYIEPDARDYFLRGIKVHQREELDNAIAYYTVVIELDSDANLVTQSYIHRGLAYQRKGEFKHAIDDFTSLIEIGYNDTIRADGYGYRGSVHRQKGEFDYAIRDFGKAIELNPNHITALYDRAMIYMREDNRVLAVKDFRGVVQLHVGSLNPTAQYYHGIAWLSLGEWENARRDLTSAKDRGIGIAVRFQDDYGSVADFQSSRGMPEDLIEMLTPQQ